MKKNLTRIVLGVILLAGWALYAPAAVPGNGSGPRGAGGGMDFGFFYDYLSPFGTWVEFSPFGYVWCPNDLGFGWRPYVNGHWLWTDDFGWFWDSDYDWGWVPFHYGRWDWDDGLGWFWVPGDIWGPAWVTWYWSDFYVGWAPLPPWVDFVAGVGISGFSRHIPARSWCFIQGGHFLDPDVRRSVMPFERNSSIVGTAGRVENISMRGDRIFNGGIGLESARSFIHRDIAHYRLEDAREPGRQRIEGNTVRIYRPQVTPNSGASPRVSIPRNVAPQRLPEIRRQARESGRPPAESPKTVRNRHKAESRLLGQSQQAERQQMRQQQMDGARRAADAAERDRIKTENITRQREIQQRHDEERALMVQRHQQEERSARQEQERQQMQQRQQPQPQPRKK